MHGTMEISCMHGPCSPIYRFEARVSQINIPIVVDAMELYLFEIVLRVAETLLYQNYACCQNLSDFFMTVMFNVMQLCPCKH